jgi:(5-formylfuran-3-yl)methyl phosphate synthase
MKVLISPTSLEEARLAAEGGADIIDVKNTSEGSLGANFPWVIREIVDGLREYPVTFSATLGDLPFKPGTASLAAAGAAASGAQYVKAGLYGTRTLDEAITLMQSVSRACREYDPAITVVAAGYADYRRFNGLPPQTIVQAAARSQANVVMIDTAIKDGSTLFDNMSVGAIRTFIAMAHEHHLAVALAGSIGTSHVPLLKELSPDIVGVRGAVCGNNDRSTAIHLARVRDFVSRIHCSDSGSA